jgi:hypothetical protein
MEVKDLIQRTLGENLVAVVAMDLIGIGSSFTK